MNKLISKYKQSNNLLIIGSFPERGQNYSANLDATAWYLRNRLTSMEKTQGTKAILFTHTDDKTHIYEDGNSLIIRCFKRNNPLSWIKLLKYVLQFNRSQNLLIEFEFASFGDTLTTILFPFLLLALRLIGKNVTIEVHQALLDLNKLHGHIGHKKNNLQIKFMSKVVKLFYGLIGRISNQVIVLEEEFKTRLSSIINPSKIEAIPLGVNLLKSINKKTARKKLNLPESNFLVLNFGYLTWYKGSDLAVNSMKHINNKHIKLVLAGGESFTQKNKPHYQKYVSKLNGEVGSNVITTGFAAEKDIALYFSAADLVILPYRTFMSSSGPLSLALSFNKPVLLGDPLRQYQESNDFKTAMTKAGLKPEDLFVPIEPKKLATSIIKSRNKQKLAKLVSFSKELKKLRSFDEQAVGYYQIITKETKEIAPIQNPNLSVNLKYVRSS